MGYKNKCKYPFTIIEMVRWTVSSEEKTHFLPFSLAISQFLGNAEKSSSALEKCVITLCWDAELTSFLPLALLSAQLVNKEDGANTRLVRSIRLLFSCVIGSTTNSRQPSTQKAEREGNSSLTIGSRKDETPPSPLYNIDWEDTHKSHDVDDIKQQPGLGANFCKHAVNGEVLSR